VDGQMDGRTLPRHDGCGVCEVVCVVVGRSSVFL
jgi:hypothetical protein